MFEPGGYILDGMTHWDLDSSGTTAQAQRIKLGEANLLVTVCNKINSINFAIREVLELSTRNCSLCLGGKVGGCNLLLLPDVMTMVS